jgi:hypothetical protein
VKNIGIRDVRFLKNGLAVKKALKTCVLTNSNTPLLFAACLNKHGPSRAAIVFKGKTWTLGDIEHSSNQVLYHTHSRCSCL